MSGLTVTCPHCQTKVRLKSSKMLGKKVNCRKCDSPFVLKADGQKKSQSARRPRSEDLEESGTHSYDPERIRARRLKKRKSASGSKSVAKDSSSKKSKSSKKSDSQIPLPLLIGGCVLGLCVTAGLIYFVYSMGSSLNSGATAKKKAAAPVKFAKFEPEVGDFGCEYPEGWTVKNGGGKGGVQSWAQFLSPDESTKISIRGNMTGAALGGAGISMTHGADADEIEPPVVDIHRLMKIKFSDDYPNYEEIGAHQLFKTKMGDTCSSIFTTKTMFGGKQKGYRVTLLTGRVQFNLICLCDEGLFEQMRPTFDKVIQTIHEK